MRRVGFWFPRGSSEVSATWGSPLSLEASDFKATAWKLLLPIYPYLLHSLDPETQFLFPLRTRQPPSGTGLR